MNLTVLSIFLHLSSIISAVKDLEKLIADAIAGKNVSADVQAVLDDLAGLFTKGLLSVPGVSSDQAVAALQDLKKAL